MQFKSKYLLLISKISELYVNDEDPLALSLNKNTNCN